MSDCLKVQQNVRAAIMIWSGNCRSSIITVVVFISTIIITAVINYCVSHMELGLTLSLGNASNYGPDMISVYQILCLPSIWHKYFHMTQVAD